MARVEINSGGHQVVVDDDKSDRADVAREARRLWEKTRVQSTRRAGFITPDGVRRSA